MLFQPSHPGAPGDVFLSFPLSAWFKKEGNQGARKGIHFSQSGNDASLPLRGGVRSDSRQEFLKMPGTVQAFSICEAYE